MLRLLVTSASAPDKRPWQWDEDQASSWFGAMAAAAAATEISGPEYPEWRPVKRFTLPVSDATLSALADFRWADMVGDVPEVNIWTALETLFQQAPHDVMAEVVSLAPTQAFVNVMARIMGRYGVLQTTWFRWWSEAGKLVLAYELEITVASTHDLWFTRSKDSSLVVVYSVVHISRQHARRLRAALGEALGVIRKACAWLRRLCHVVDSIDVPDEVAQHEQRADTWALYAGIDHCTTAPLYLPVLEAYTDMFDGAPRVLLAVDFETDPWYAGDDEIHIRYSERTFRTYEDESGRTFLIDDEDVVDDDEEAIVAMNDASIAALQAVPDGPQSICLGVNVNEGYDADYDEGHLRPCMRILQLKET
jgi:hypothetical protein